MIRQYLKDYKLKARPLCADSIEAVSSMGTEFQKYVLGQKTEAEFFAGAQNCIDQYYKKSIVLNCLFFVLKKIKKLFFYKTY